MNILVIPTTDWIHHPVPNRLNFIFDILTERHSVYVLHFNLKKFERNVPRKTKCTLVEDSSFSCLDPSLYYLTNSPMHMAIVARAVREKNIDVILSSNIVPSFFANFSGAPIVFDYLDHLEESASIYYPGSMFQGLVKTSVRFLTRYNLHHARHLITVTEELKDYLLKIGDVQVTTIPNGVDTKLLTPLSKDQTKSGLGLHGTVLGYIGSLEYWVDLETVIEALPNLNVTLLVVGPGLFTDYGSKMKALAAEKGVSDKIIFTGSVPYENLGRYISAMDIGLNPLKMMKKNEYAAGGKVFNYLSCDRPVLSSRMISLERLLGNELYYYDDVKSFVTQVHAILQEKPEEGRYRKIAERYDWRILAEQYEKVLLSVL